MGVFCHLARPIYTQHIKS